MTKYVKLNPEKTEWRSALFNVKPRPVRRHPDSKLPEFDWYTVIEHHQTLPDRELYRHERDRWELIDSVVHIYYTPALVNVERVREIMCQRVDQHRDRLLEKPLEFQGHEIDASEKTLRRILGVYAKAMSDPEFSIQWIAVDNTLLDLDADAIRQLGDSFAFRESKIVLMARQAKNFINEHPEPHSMSVAEIWDKIEKESSNA